MQHGAVLFSGGDDGESTAMALARSKERQDAYAEGRYRPRLYMLIWPRSALLRWSGVK